MTDIKTKLDRYRMKIQQYRQWLGEFPEVAHVLDTLNAAVEGTEGLNAGTPCGMEFCTVDGLREQLRKLRDEKEAAVLAASAPAQEPMYQIKNLPNTPDAFKNCWFDASEQAYHYTPENQRRILYAAAVVAPAILTEATALYNATGALHDQWLNGTGIPSTTWQALHAIRNRLMQSLQASQSPQDQVKP